MDAQRPRSDVDRRAAEDARRARRGAVTDPAVVMEAAARFLAARSRSVAETRRRLRHLGYQDGLVEHVLLRLQEMGYLDDVAFATAWVGSRDRARPRGEAALRQELRVRGVETSVVDRVLAARTRDLVGAGLEVGPDRGGGPVAPGLPDRPGGPAAADRAAAARLLSRRAAALDRERDPWRRRHRAYALLARNGFDPDVCRDVSLTVAGSDADDLDE